MVKGAHSLNFLSMAAAILYILCSGLANRIVSGSILLTRLCQGSSGNVFIVALWHACHNLVSGTAAAYGAHAALVSGAVMVWAVVIVVAEVRKGRREIVANPNLTATTPWL